MSACAVGYRMPVQQAVHTPVRSACVRVRVRVRVRAVVWYM